jgi:type I restriction enzyme, S subunit
VMTKASEEQDLPGGWSLALIGEIAETIRGVTYKKEESSLEPNNGLIPILWATNIGDGLDFEELVYVPPNNVSADQFLRVNDIILAASSGSRAIVGKAAILSSEWKGSFGAFCYALRPNLLINAKLLAYFLQTSEYRNHVSNMSAGVNINNLRREHIESISYRLAPNKEQGRIVEKIEEQFTRLDAAVAALKRVQANLKRYRATVLKAAYDGRLIPTDAELARRDGCLYESGSTLLERTLVERRSRWEATQKKGKYKDARLLDTSILPTLPEGWAWAPLGAIAELKGGLTKGQKRKATEIVREVPYLRVANVQRGYLDLEEVKTIEATEEEITELRLEDGDVLFNEGGDRDKLGRGWVWEGKIAECVHQNHVFRARLVGDVMKPKLLSWYGNSIGRQYFEDEGKQTTNLASLNMTKLSMLPVPIPPVAEQERIVAELERRLSVVDEVDAEVSANLKRAERLRQSVLLFAFKGALVPQDQADEPASIFLERIRREREAKSGSQTPKGRRREVAVP